MKHWRGQRRALRPDEDATLALAGASEDSHLKSLMLDLTDPSSIFVTENTTLKILSSYTCFLTQLCC